MDKKNIPDPAEETDFSIEGSVKYASKKEGEPDEKEIKVSFRDEIKIWEKAFASFISTFIKEEKRSIRNLNLKIFKGKEERELMDEFEKPEEESDDKQ